MEFKWDEYVTAVTDATTKAALEKLQAVGQDAAKQGAQYVVEQYRLIQKYTEQKAKGEITEDDYKSLMLDLADIMKLEALKANIATRKLINDLVMTTLNIAMNCLSALIVL